MRGSKPNEVEVNEERSSRAGDGMQKGTREYIQNDKGQEPRKWDERKRMGILRFLKVTSAVVVATSPTARPRLSA